MQRTFRGLRTDIFNPALSVDYVLSTDHTSCPQTPFRLEAPWSDVLTLSYVIPPLLSRWSKGWPVGS